MAKGLVEDRFAYERRFYESSNDRLAGVDEAGRGPLAGPVVAAAVVLPRAWSDQGMPEDLQGLNDSKKLTARQREGLFSSLREHQEILWGVSVVEPGIIDDINILQATHQAMNFALSKLSPPAAHALVDGCPVPSLSLPHTAIVKGDSKSYSIAAASILAKVTRDCLMLEFHERWPEYGFADHKGYGTAGHLAALAEHGPCPIHRMSFAPLKPEPQQELF